MDPPTNRSTYDPRWFEESTLTVARCLKKASTITIVPIFLRGNEVLKLFPEVAHNYPPHLNSYELSIAVGLEESTSPISTMELIKLSAEKLGRIPLKKLPKHQCCLFLKNQGVFEHLSDKNLATICSEAIPFFREYINPDDLPAKPFLVLPLRLLAKAINYLKSHPERFPTLIERIAKKLTSPLPDAIYAALPMAYRKNFLEQRPSKEKETACAGWVAATMPLSDLTRLYGNALIQLSSQAAIQEKDRIRLEFEKIFECRSHEDFAHLVNIYGFSHESLFLLPSSFITTLKLDSLKYTQWIDQKGFEKSTMGEVFDPLVKDPEFISLLRKLNEPQLLYLYHLQMVINDVVRKIFDNGTWGEFTSRYNVLIKKCLEEYRANFCRTPSGHKLTEVILKYFLNMQGDSKKYPSWCDLHEQTESYFIGSPQKLL